MIIKVFGAIILSVMVRTYMINKCFAFVEPGLQCLFSSIKQGR
jgi:hypothetical protein